MASKLMSIARGGKNLPSKNFRVPARISKYIPDDQRFEAELTTDGILLKAVVEGKENVPSMLPDWAKR